MPSDVAWLEGVARNLEEEAGSLSRVLVRLLCVQQDLSKWTKALPLIMLGIRTALKEDLQCSTAELVYGTTLRLPGEFLIQAHLPLFLTQ